MKTYRMASIRSKFYFNSYEYLSNDETIVGFAFDIKHGGIVNAPRPLHIVDIFNNKILKTITFNISSKEQVTYSINTFLNNPNQIVVNHKENPYWYFNDNDHFISQIKSIFINNFYIKETNDGYVAIYAKDEINWQLLYLNKENKDIEFTNHFIPTLNDNKEYHNIQKFAVAKNDHNKFFLILQDRNRNINLFNGNVNKKLKRYPIDIAITPNGENIILAKGESKKKATKEFEILDSKTLEVKRVMELPHPFTFVRVSNDNNKLAFGSQYYITEIDLD